MNCKPEKHNNLLTVKHKFQFNADFFNINQIFEPDNQNLNSFNCLCLHSIFKVASTLIHKLSSKKSLTELYQFVAWFDGSINSTLINQKSKFCSV